MNEGRSHAHNETRNLGYAHRRLEAGVCSRPLDRALGRVALFLYFFVMPAYRHSFAVWMEFAVLYATFLILYFLVVELTGRWQAVAFVLFFLSSFSITRSTRTPT